MRLLIEYAISLLPFENITVQTPQGTAYNGTVQLIVKQKDYVIDSSFLGKKRSSSICGVSILRAGETLEGFVEFLISFSFNQFQPSFRRST